MSTKCFHLPHGVTIIRWSLGNFSQRHAEIEGYTCWASELFQVAGNGHATQALLTLWPKGDSTIDDCYADLYVPWIDQKASVELNVAMWLEVARNERIEISVETEVFQSDTTRTILQLEQEEVNQLLVGQENVFLVCEIRRVLPPELPIVKDPAPTHLYWVMDEVSSAICLVGEWRSDWFTIDDRLIKCSLLLEHPSRLDDNGGVCVLCLDVNTQEANQPGCYIYSTMWAESLDGRYKTVKNSFVAPFPKTFENPILSRYFPNQITKELLDEYERNGSIIFRAYVKVVSELPVHFDANNIDNETTHVQHINGMTKIRCPINNFVETFNKTEKGETWISELFSVAGDGHEVRACLRMKPKDQLGFSILLYLVDVANDGDVHLESNTWIEKAGQIVQLDVAKVEGEHRRSTAMLSGLLYQSNVEQLLRDGLDIVVHCEITRKYAPPPLPLNFVAQPMVLSWNVKDFRSKMEIPDRHVGAYFVITGYEHVNCCLVFERLAEPDEDWNRSYLLLRFERFNLYDPPITLRIQTFVKTINGNKTLNHADVYTLGPDLFASSFSIANQFDDQPFARVAQEDDEITFECIVELILAVKTEGEDDLTTAMAERDH
ncbi:hypothetical protein M3Y95_01262200 [Aphelenchoides besseyi]|nr:hypothetical protein M3Y95_01262200 [Aphelenchoides besseyi]